MWVMDETGDTGDLYWGTDDGYVYQYDYGYTDAGSAITAQFRWGFTDCKNAVQVKNFSRAVVPARVTGTINVILNVDFSKKTQTKTTSSYLPSGVGIWDSGLWDTALWGESWVATRKVRFNKMNGVKVALQITHSYLDKVEIHPFKIEYFPKELTRFP